MIQDSFKCSLQTSESPSSTRKMARVLLKHSWSLQYGTLFWDLHPRCL